MFDRIKVAAVVAFILLPVIAIAVLKYSPVLNGLNKVSAISILPARLVGDFQPAEELAAVFREALSGAEGIRIQPSPSPAQIADAGTDMKKLADTVGADALVVTVLTADAGIVQLDVQIIDPATGRVLYNNPYHSPRDQYPQMIRAAGTALRRALAR
jgi:hypothetical protein